MPKNNDIDLVKMVEDKKYNPEDDVKVAVNWTIGKKQAEAIKRTASKMKWSESKVARRLLNSIVSEDGK